MGFGDDVFSLAITGHRKRNELMQYLDPMPGHKSKLEDLFIKIDSVSFIFSYHTDTYFIYRCILANLS